LSLTYHVHVLTPMCHSDHSRRSVATWSSDTKHIYIAKYFRSNVISK